jgi:hypothetical protein
MKREFFAKICWGKIPQIFETSFVVDKNNEIREGLSMEVLTKGKPQYSWPPYTN